MSYHTFERFISWSLLPMSYTMFRLYFLLLLEACHDILLIQVYRGFFGLQWTWVVYFIILVMDGFVIISRWYRYMMNDYYFYFSRYIFYMFKIYLTPGVIVLDRLGERGNLIYQWDLRYSTQPGPYWGHDNNASSNFLDQLVLDLSIGELNLPTRCVWNVFPPYTLHHIL